LKGKLVTSTQYTNWTTPVRIRKTRKASISFRREGVASRYVAQRVRSATVDADDAVAGEEVPLDWVWALGAGLVVAAAAAAAARVRFAELGVLGAIIFLLVVLFCSLDYNRNDVRGEY